MGYTHYWYRPLDIPEADMRTIAEDFSKIVLALDDMGVKLGDARGDGVPEITPEFIGFNGLAKCGHPQNSNIVIPWPTDTARGVNDGEAEAGHWFAGVKLETRTCDGDCSYESVWFPASIRDDKFLQPSAQHKGLYFSCCKTAYRPYDVAVTAFLIIAKHHLGKRLHVSSDGGDQHWQDAKVLCYAHLGYGPEYQMTDNGMVRRKLSTSKLAVRA